MTGWRVPVSTQEPLKVTSDPERSSRDHRVHYWIGALPPVDGIPVRNLVGMGKWMKLLSIHAVLDNTAGVHTQSYIQLWDRQSGANNIICDLIFHVAAGSVTYIELYQGADTVLVDENVWTYALPNFLLDYKNTIYLFPNVQVDGEYTIYYEVYDV